MPHFNRRQTFPTLARSLVCLTVAVLLSLAAGRAGAQGYSPEEALHHMKVADGFQVKLVACEPNIRQPVTMSFDDRGRLWVIQYLQYPSPAGLKPVSADQYLRTVYDRIPEPPPKGPRGADKITILEDPDETGRYRKAKDFVTGLNLASGMALGYGGVFVAQPPYLLFYPDRNGDDIPDGDPEVLLSGFGMQDAHAFPNSLQWGPDGWLYGAQGSTVTSTIRGVTFQQGIWRYHPVTRQFELFAEGGGNTWGLDFDRHGQAIAGTNFGGVAMLHQVQGAYYVKNFAKHGELQNPHAYGYFEHVPYQGFRGGHVTCGGIVYQGGSFPGPFANTYLAANPLSNAIYWHVLEPKGSSFTAHFGGELLAGHDTWFRPVDCLVGPDGSLFVADWYDKRINHVDPVDNWDRSNGRIYKVEANGTKPVPPGNLGKLSGKELVALLGHPNSWYAGEARRILAERRDPSVVPLLREILLRDRGDLALQALWALYGSGGFTDALAETLLDHPNPDVRAWTVRFLGDAKVVSPALQARLVAVARGDLSCTVRSQLACSCKRLPARNALPVLRELLGHAEDVEDPHIPLLLWWAIEDKAVSDRGLVLGLLDSPAAWHNPLIGRFIVERLSRRYLAEGNEAGLTTCARLLAMAPEAGDRERVVRGMEKALEGRSLQTVPAVLDRQITDLWNKDPSNLMLLRLALRLGRAEAFRRALDLVAAPSLPEEDRVRLVEVLGQAGNRECVPRLLELLGPSQPAGVRSAALAALQSFPDRPIADTVLDLYPRMPFGLRGRARDLLCGRASAALLFLEAVEAGRIDPKEVPLEQVRRLLLHPDPRIHQLVEKHWGHVGREPPGEKRARMQSIQHLLAQGNGDARKGKELFQKKCAACHTLFGEGAHVGPDLTGADRKDLDFLVTSIVDPSAVIRNEYVAYVVETTSGRVLTGLMAEAGPQTLTLLDGKNERTTVARKDIEAIKPLAQSLMPEGILDDLDDQAVRDLFSYLRGDGPVAADPPEVLPGTRPLTAGGDRAAQMVAGIDRYLMRELAASVGKRQALWKPNGTTFKTYLESVKPNRERLKKMLGVVDARVPVT